MGIGKRSSRKIWREESKGTSNFFTIIKAEESFFKFCFLSTSFILQLSDIAQTARKLADEHENRSQEFERIADKTFEASKQAVTEAQEAIWGG